MQSMILAGASGLTISNSFKWKHVRGYPFNNFRGNREAEGALGCGVWYPGLGIEFSFLHVSTCVVLSSHSCTSILTIPHLLPNKNSNSRVAMTSACREPAGWP